MQDDLYLTEILHNLEILEVDALQTFAVITKNEELAKHARKLVRNIKARQNPLRRNNPNLDDLVD